MSIQNLLAELHKDYVDSIPGKVALIESLWQQGRLDDLTTEYHKIKGSGRTYGVPEITQVGEAMEHLCETQRDQLPHTVPLSLRLMTRIQTSRSAGQVFPLEDDPDFAKIISLLNLI